MGIISIKGIDKAEVLAKLYNASKPQGLGFMHYDPEEMRAEEAQAILNENPGYIGYLRGRVMKVDLSGDEFITHLYNRDNGHNAAERALGLV